MEGREIKRRNWIRGTEAYKHRNKWINRLMLITLGTGALFYMIIPKENNLTRLITSEREEKEARIKRELEIAALRAEAGALDMAESKAS